MTHTEDPALAAATPVPDRERRASFVSRLQRRAGGTALALCAGIDPSPAACALIEFDPVRVPGAARSTRAARIERFAGLVIESVRDHAIAVKPQIAWFEAAGAPGMRALERTVAFARTAGLLVIIDAKRGDVPHSAEAYADAWLGDEASTGCGGDSLTVNATFGRDSLEAMATIAHARHCALHALLLTSNPGASELQSAPLESGGAWWQQLAAVIRDVDTAVSDGAGVVGAVAGATRPEQLEQIRAELPTTSLLVPGVGAQSGSIDDVARAIVFMDSLPLDTNVPSLTIMATLMPYIGRG